MEITSEIKAKVFAPYLGQRVSISGRTHELGTLTTSDRKKVDLFYVCDNISHLILRPLLAITDEEAIEAAKLFGGVNGEIELNRIKPEDISNPDIHFVVQVFQNRPEWKSFSLPKIWHEPNGYSTFVYQWLQSKGYDLPNFLLGGKTLKEAGLAVYL